MVGAGKLKIVERLEVLEEAKERTATEVKEGNYFEAEKMTPSQS
eukprot:CAMPEP_0202968402 /NCGR_PEP_ID=MMETSP1396-20130829/13669_1 /ASSEMBLY_ACC=CAM_ASM_000872 /TAXON_ID= /ORGANISM="Pseudokeronopsis sp., Strain Brazil" /LENGTH=43 /DNA_ID= /DNA_START= /DNA_END= /DNA_ORIENTATION=